MKTILITGIGGDIAQSIALIIRKAFPDWRIVGCDIHERHGGHLVADQFLIAPKANSDNFGDWLFETNKKFTLDFCLPTSEAELDVLTRSGIEQLGTAPIIMPNSLAIKTCLDKFATNKFLKSIEIPAPWTHEAEASISSLSYPCIFKYRRGAGSRQIFECQNAEEADFFRRKFPGGIFQELLLPRIQEVTCAVYRTKQGQVKTLQLLRELTGGFTGWAKTIFDPAIEDQCFKIASELELTGSINVQLRLTDNGPRIFEINPRFSSTVLIRHLMRFQDVLWTLLEAQGMLPEYYIPEPGMTGVRVQGAALLRETA